MIFYLVFLVSFMSFANAKCYWPDGGVPDDYLPCPNSKVCCKSGEACLSNGICYGAVLNIAYRGACADSSWPKDECPHICYEEIADTYANLYPCANDTKVFNCNEPNSACDGNAGHWRWIHGNVSVAQLTASSPSPSIAVPTGSSKGAPASTSSSTSIVALGAGIGVGLGVPLVAVTACLLVFCIRVQRRWHTTDMVGNNTRKQSLYGHEMAGFSTHQRGVVGELEGGRPELYGSNH